MSLIDTHTHLESFAREGTLTEALALPDVDAVTIVRKPAEGQTATSR